MGAVIAMVGAGAFGIAVAVVLANKLLTDDPNPIAQNDVPDDPDPIVDPTLQLDPVADPIPEHVDPVVEDPAIEDPVVPEHHATMHVTMHSMQATSMSSNNDNLTEEQRRLLATLQMSGMSETIGMIDLGMTHMTSMRQALDESAVRRVVGNRTNQQSLQRCYNRAIRGMGDPPDVRLDVSIRVGASGRVTSASARGQDIAGFKGCVETQIRRWRFPPSSSGGQTAFPVVFTAPR